MSTLTYIQTESEKKNAKILLEAFTKNKEYIESLAELGYTKAVIPTLKCRKNGNDLPYCFKKDGWFSRKHYSIKLYKYILEDLQKMFGESVKIVAQTVTTRNWLWGKRSYSYVTLEW